MATGQDHRSHNRRPFCRTLLVQYQRPTRLSPVPIIVRLVRYIHFLNLGLHYRMRRPSSHLRHSRLGPTSTRRLGRMRLIQIKRGQPQVQRSAKHQATRRNTTRRHWSAALADLQVPREQGDRRRSAHCLCRLFPRFRSLNGGIKRNSALNCTMNFCFTRSVEDSVLSALARMTKIADENGRKRVRCAPRHSKMDGAETMAKDHTRSAVPAIGLFRIACEVASARDAVAMQSIEAIGRLSE
jgi:hypothetical protein